MTSFKNEIERKARQHALLDEGDPYPPIVFRDADEDVVERLLTSITKETVALSHALSALAWTRSKRAVDTLISWTEKPPAWRADIHIDPVAYTYEAGYEVENGAIRSLVGDRALGMVAATANESADATLFEPWPAEECSACGSHLMLLWSTKRVDFPISSQLPICFDCVVRGATIRVDADGKTRFLAQSKVATDKWRPEPVRVRLVEETPWANARYLSGGGSRIGGHPTWIQDAEYPKCPDCKRTMPFVAEVSLEEFILTDGIIYVHECAADQVGVLGFQST